MNSIHPTAFGATAGRQFLAGLQNENAAPQEEKPELDRVGERLSMTVTELISSVDALEARLSSVTRPITGESANAGNPPQPVRCPLGDRLDVETDRIWGVVERVRVLMSVLAT